MSESKTKKNILDTICDQRRLDVIDAKKSISTEDLILRVRERKERVVNLFEKIKSREGIHVAAEFKRASPSKGDIATHLSAPEQTLRYAKAGASVISVLTEPKWFKGPTSEDDKLMFRKALANYLAKNYDGSKSYPKADVKLYMNVLKELVKLLPKWSKVNEHNFSTHHSLPNS